MSLKVSYEPFFETIKNKKITQTNLIRKYNVSSSLFGKLKRGENVQLSTVIQLMKDVGTTEVEDIMVIVVIEEKI